ncbi:MAG: EF-P lysine aminoacylase EpmA [Pseudomonadales bacterium]
MSKAWLPTASNAALHKRADLYRSIREFFRARDVLEVETPCVSRHGVTDPHIASVAVAGHGWLQSSPEFAMKRLLAAGSGSIFQICKSFRGGEAGTYHNPEFTLLEWYRIDFNDHRLMDEVEQLLALLLGGGTARRCSYGDLFQQRLRIDPHQASHAELQKLVDQHIDTSCACVDKDQCLELLFSHLLQLDLSGLTFIHDFPASQAALARLASDANGTTVARRFECFFDGVELANGYDELTDAEEYLRRCEADNVKRAAYGLPAMEIDAHFASAMQHGLPDCAGVALGLDRLLMLMLGASSIEEVLSFPARRA